ncbi:MAG TPA: substrate-binding domain-containing protein [Vicinamibacterales bacterium]|jgi:ribose transport system substrate-binding protein|nr:substrate-binding domain-containing protein [Vicinamibacterales bacterium]
MSIRKPLLVLLALLPLVSISAACGRSGSTTGTPAKPVIAVIPKGTTHEYWKSVHAGAVKAARDHGAEIIWKGPIREDDRDEQVKVVETFLAQKIDGIVIAPLDDRALVPVLKDAAARHIPVVIVDSDVKWDGYLSFVATDNEKAGGLAAERLGEVLGGKGKVVMMRYQEGSASTMAREAGFLSTLAAKFPNIKVVSDNQYGGATTETAYATAESLLATYADVDGVFCPNESTAFGMLLAIQAAGRAGKIHLVGFDASDKLIEGLRQGNIDGLVVQNPFRMGETGVNFLLQSLNGQTVPRRVDTGATMVTRENMDQPEVKALLQPDLAAYLN